MQRRLLAVPILALLCASCVPGDGPSMRPFEDCLSCHSSGEARAWTVAGTWRHGATVTVVDRNGKTVTMRGNEVGNFYTAEGLTFPLTVYVDGKVMTSPSDHVTPKPLTYGGCNLCHHAETLSVGPLMAPGFDCLTCHGPGGMAEARFTAAGTWGATTGTSVTLGGTYATTTNAAGNFVFCASGNPCTWEGASYGTVAPITISSGSPSTVRVGNQTMGPPLTYGGCNACHGRGGEGNDR
jgi:hypothetical protein